MKIKQRYQKHVAAERGTALILSLVFLGVLSLLGMTASTITSTDALIGGNYKINVRAFEFAEAGIEEARGRLRGTPAATTYAGDPAASVNPNWSAYLLTDSGWQISDDPDYNASFTNYIPAAGAHTNTSVTANTLQPNPPAMSYWVKIRHKREYDAELMGHDPSQSPPSLHYFDNDGSASTNTAAARGSIIYYGYGNPAAPTTAMQFTTGAPTPFKPVEIIRTYGSSASGVRVVEIEATTPPGPPTLAAIYGKVTVTINGGGGGNMSEADGRDHCNPNLPLPDPANYPDVLPVYTVTNPTTDNGNVVYNGEGTPPVPVQGTWTIDVPSFISAYKENAVLITDRYATNISSFGDANNFGAWYADANSFNPSELRLSGVTGYGLLLIDGDVAFSGPISWHGLIVVNGDITFNGAGGLNVDIFGAVIAEGSVTVNGNPDVAYHRCNISKALASLPLTILSWREIF